MNQRAQQIRRLEEAIRREETRFLMDWYSARLMEELGDAPAGELEEEVASSLLVARTVASDEVAERITDLLRAGGYAAAVEAADEDAEESENGLFAEEEEDGASGSAGDVAAPEPPQEAESAADGDQAEAEGTDDLFGEEGEEEDAAELFGHEEEEGAVVEAPGSDRDGDAEPSEGEEEDAAELFAGDEKGEDRQADEGLAGLGDDEGGTGATTVDVRDEGDEEGEGGGSVSELFAGDEEPTVADSDDEGEGDLTPGAPEEGEGASELFAAEERGADVDDLFAARGAQDGTGEASGAEELFAETDEEEPQEQPGEEGPAAAVEEEEEAESEPDDGESEDAGVLFRDDIYSGQARTQAGPAGQRPGSGRETRQTPGFTPTQGHEERQTPGFTPTQGHEERQTPGFKPSKGAREGRTPGFQPASERPAEETPGFTPSKGHEERRTPGFVPTQGHEERQTRGFKARRGHEERQTPGFEATGEQQAEETRGFTPTRGHEERQTPGFSPKGEPQSKETPGFKPTGGHEERQTPGFRPKGDAKSKETPGFKPTRGHEERQTPGFRPKGEPQAKETPGFRARGPADGQAEGESRTRGSNGEAQPARRFQVGSELADKVKQEQEAKQQRRRQRREEFFGQQGSEDQPEGTDAPNPDELQVDAFAHFITLDDLEQYLGVSVFPEDREKLEARWAQQLKEPPIQRLVQEIKREHWSYALVPRVPRLLRGGRRVATTVVNLLRNYPQFFENVTQVIQYKAEAFFAAETPGLDWAIVSCEVLPESRNKNFMEQRQVLKQYAQRFRANDLRVRRRTLVEALYDVLVIDLITKEPVLTKTVDLTESRVGRYNFACINFGSGGVRISDVSGQQTNPHLGLCPSW